MTWFEQSNVVADLINFDCPFCGQNIDADSGMAGMTLPCPSCEGQMVIPVEAGEPALPALMDEDDAEWDEPEASEGGEGSAASLADLAPAAPAPTGATTLRKRCHSCGEVCPPDAVICVQCGYNFETRKSVTGNDPGTLLDTSEATLRRLAFQLNEKGWIEMPEASHDPMQADFLDQLNVGRSQALALRSEYKKIQPLAEQSFDPLDSPAPNYFSLAILFDGDQFGDDFGREMLLIFLHKVRPDSLRQKVVLHVGNMIGFENLCAIVVRGAISKDVVAIAGHFGPELEDSVLLPHPLRFMTAPKSDGHLLQRTFSLPIEGALVREFFQPDQHGRIGKTLQEKDLAPTPWKLAP